MTPSEFNDLSETYDKTQRGEVELAKASAYWTAALSRTKKLPNFDSWMNPPKPARALTGEEAELRERQHQEDVATLMELKAKHKAAMEQQG